MPKKKTNGTTILTGGSSPAHKKHGYSTGAHTHKLYEEEMMTKQNKYKNLGASKKS